MDSQNITPNKKLNTPNNQILLIGYLPPISNETIHPIPKSMNKINEITEIIENISFII